MNNLVKYKTPITEWHLIEILGRGYTETRIHFTDKGIWISRYEENSKYNPQLCEYHPNAITLIRNGITHQRYGWATAKSILNKKKI